MSTVPRLALTGPLEYLFFSVVWHVSVTDRKQNISQTKQDYLQVRPCRGTDHHDWRSGGYHSHIHECKDSTLKLEMRFSFYILLSSLLNNRFTYVVWATDSIFYKP